MMLGASITTGASGLTSSILTTGGSWFQRQDDFVMDGCRSKSFKVSVDLIGKAAPEVQSRRNSDQRVAFSLAK